jgi:hypothetical protein
LLDVALFYRAIVHAVAACRQLLVHAAPITPALLRILSAAMACSLQALIDALLARKHELPGVETEGQLLRWLFHLQTDRGVLLPEAPGASAAARPAAAGAAGGAKRTLTLSLRAMLQRLLAHPQPQFGQKLATHAEQVLIADLKKGANRPGRLSVPRMPPHRAARLLQKEVPALQPYLLVS